jgi:hypothetical protein
MLGGQIHEPPLEAGNLTAINAINQGRRNRLIFDVLLGTGLLALITYNKTKKNNQETRAIHEKHHSTKD